MILIMYNMLVDGLVPAHFAISLGIRPRSCIAHMVPSGSQLGSSLLCIKRSAFFSECESNSKTKGIIGTNSKHKRIAEI